MSEAGLGSILAVDCGTVTTKAMLLDRVAGEYRFVAYGEAPTSCAQGSPITQGVVRAVQRISQLTGRYFFDERGNLISPQTSSQRGVDAFAATVSAGEPLQVVLDGLVEDLSISSAQRALAGTYSKVRAVLGPSSEDGWTAEDRVRALRTIMPDVVLVVGGIDGGAEQPILDAVRATTLACAMMDRDKRPTIVYAGNSQLREAVTGVVGNEAELRVVDNVRPDLERESVQAAQEELRRLFRKRKMSQLPGMATLQTWSSVPVTPTAQALGQVVSYLWHLGDPTRGVMGIDVGGASTTVAAAFDGQLSVTIHGSLGITFGGRRLIEKHGFQSVARWMPESVSPHEFRALLLTKEIYPTSIPHVGRELWMDQALACASIRTVLNVARPGWACDAAQPYPALTPLCDTILISGACLSRTPDRGQAALTVLNAVEPIGVTTLVYDEHGIGPALGSVAAVKPVAAVEALDAGGFVNLATVIVPVGEVSDQGASILEIHVTYEDGGKLEIEVYTGDLEIVPLNPGQEAVLELRPASGVDVGLGGPGKSGKRRVSGSQVGLVIDARGRPLQIPDEPSRRRAHVERWLHNVGAQIDD